MISSEIPKKLTDLTECPFCGCEEFYTKDRVHGTLRYRERFDGDEADNSTLYDGLVLVHTKYRRVFCVDCESLLGERYSNTLSVAVKKLLNKG